MSPFRPQNACNPIAQNNLTNQAQICTAFGIKLIVNSGLIPITKTASYDSLFFDLEHTKLRIRDGSRL